MHDETEHTQYFIVKIENSFNLFVSKFLNNYQSITKLVLMNYEVISHKAHNEICSYTKQKTQMRDKRENENLKSCLVLLTLILISYFYFIFFKKEKQFLSSFTFLSPLIDVL